MSKKRLARYINISLILIISSSYITLDLFKAFIESNLNPLPSLVLKGIIVLLTTVLVFLIGDNGISKMDTKLLRLIYISIVLADLSLVMFNKPYMGIIIFSSVQILLIYRNSSCMNRKISVKDNKFLALLLIILLIIYLSLIENQTTDSYLFKLFIFYGIIKSSSVFVAILSFRLKIYPPINGYLLLIGVICFYLCDLNVGLTLAFNGSIINKISGLMIWIFYTPALTLIALSGYDFKEIKKYYN